MKAMVFHGIGDIGLNDVKEPQIKDPQDAIVRITACAICGTDLHMVRGTMPGMKAGTILGHEGVGVVEETGEQVRNFHKGDRVVIASTIACGYCSYCRDGYYSQCDVAHPSGHAFFGGPKEAGSFDGMQAEFVRVPFASVGMFRVPDGVTDGQALLLSDIFPTGYFGVSLADVRPGRTVAVFGCGPVGQFAILSSFLVGAGRVFAVDCVPSRLAKARELGAEAIDFNEEDPVAVIRELTGGIGVDRAIDAVGVDAVRPSRGPAVQSSSQIQQEFEREMRAVVPEEHGHDGNWVPGNAPSQSLRWSVAALAKAGKLGIIGVYPPSVDSFPIGMAMNRNLSINMGNCNHRRYIPRLMDLVHSGAVNPEKIITCTRPLVSALDAYRHFDKREDGWLKVELVPSTERHSAGAGI